MIYMHIVNDLHEICSPRSVNVSNGCTVGNVLVAVADAHKRASIRLSTNREKRAKVSPSKTNYEHQIRLDDSAT